MNITNINPYQGVQNAFHSDSGKGSSADSNGVSSAIQSESNPTVLVDPPLFPIARYQNPNLMQKSTPTEAEINASQKNQTGTILSVKI